MSDGLKILMMLINTKYAINVNTYKIKAKTADKANWIQMRSHDKNLFGGDIRLHGVLQGLSEVLKAHFNASWSRQLPGTNEDAEFIQHVT